jgi:hypothetical protein
VTCQEHDIVDGDQFRTIDKGVGALMNIGVERAASQAKPASRAACSNRVHSLTQRRSHPLLCGALS